MRAGELLRRICRRWDETGGKTNRRLLAASIGLIGLARPITVGVLVLALSAFIGFGSAAMMFVYSLRPEFFSEHQARLRYEKTHHAAVAG